MVGPATAGVIIAVLGSGIRATGWVILLNGLSYVAVVMSLKRMHSEELHPTAPLPAPRDSYAMPSATCARAPTSCS